MVAGAVSLPLLTAGGTAVADDHPRGTTLYPAKLDRGEVTPLFHSVGKAIVDGHRRIRVDPGEWMYPLGRRGGEYLVMTVDDGFEKWQVFRVGADSELGRLAEGGSNVPLPLASDDGSHVALLRTNGARTRVTVRNSLTGKVLRRRSFAGSVEMLDYGTRRLVLTEWAARRSRTFWWNPHNNAQVRISRRPAHLAEVSADRVSLHFTRRRTDDCLRVVRLSAPGTTLWRSCRDQVVKFSPDGRRMVTSGESDDHRPPLLQVRRGHGRVLATYRARQFGFVEWEDNRSVLIEALGRTYTAAVRCRPPSGCERASRLHKHPGRSPQQMSWSFPGQVL